MMSAFVSFARESSTDVKWKSVALPMVNMSCVVRLRLRLRTASMGLSGNSADFRHRRSRLVERFRKTSKAFGVARPRSIPKTRTSVIETLDRAGAEAPSDEALMNDISRQRYDALTELYGRHRQRL